MGMDIVADVGASASPGAGRQRSDGRERLLQAAIALFLDAGYDGVSMQQIADAAHMTKGAPYHHFAGKDDLFARAVQRHLAELDRGIGAALDAPDDLRQGLIDAFCLFAARADAGMARLVEDLQRHVGAQRIHDYGITPECLRTRYRERFAAAEAAGAGLACPPDRAAEVLLAVQVGILHRLNSCGQPRPSADDLRELAAGTVDALLYGVLARD